VDGATIPTPRAPSSPQADPALSCSSPPSSPGDTTLGRPGTGAVEDRELHNRYASGILLVEPRFGAQGDDGTVLSVARSPTGTP
jgi:hypothetical protein